MSVTPETPAPNTSGTPRSLRLEHLTVLHVAVMVIGAAWAIGGNTEWARIGLSWWGSLAMVITLGAVRSGWRTRRVRRTLIWLLPVLLFDAFAGISIGNPSFHLVQDGAFVGFVQNSLPLAWPHLPSTARPDLTFQSLWYLNAAYLTAFSLTLAVHRRRSIRLLLAILVANALALAVFGTTQKLFDAKGLYFGLKPTIQPYFFGPFIYHNHWGAFTLLMLAAVTALLFHHARRRASRDFWHSPALTALVCMAFLATTIPLSRSRSSVLLGVLLLGVAGAHGLVGAIRRRRRFGEPVSTPVLGFVGGTMLVASFIYVLARPMINERLANTREQLAEIRADTTATPRLVLYRDTWRLARDRLWLGWGLGAYPTAFYSRNTQYYSHNGPNRVFLDAHSDWLQSIAEVGLVGSALIASCVLVPLTALRRRSLGNPIVSYLLLGCGITVLYATLEFPFGNRAVVAAFWTLFFAAVQYARLSDSQSSQPPA